MADQLWLRFKPCTPSLFFLPDSPPNGLCREIHVINSGSFLSLIWAIHPLLSQKKTSKMSQRDTCCRHLRTCMPKFASLQAFETLWKQLQSKNPMSTETSTLWHLSSHKLKRSCCASPSSAVETIKTTGRNLMLGPRLSTLSPTGPQLPTSNPSLQQLNV